MRYHRYQIEYMGRDYEVVCPRYVFEDGTEVIVIPWWLIPGRPYPLPVYLFACSLYSANPKLGQRGAAEGARVKFKLETFSHSTVSRSFRSFEEAQRSTLENRYGKEIKICGAEGLGVVLPVGRQDSVSAKSDVGVDEGCHQNKDGNPDSEKRLPSVSDTLTRREAMSDFLPKFKKDAATSEIEAAGIDFAKKWHEKSRRLLL